MKNRFGVKCAKIPIDAGFTCPNIDGSKGIGGCIYCSGGSAGTGTDCLRSISEQYNNVCEIMDHKWAGAVRIPYLQAHTNTYGNIDRIIKVCEEALSLPGAAGLHIATRADCLSSETVEYLAGLSKRTYLCVELGLQTAHDSTAEKINRCHSFDDFLQGYGMLRNSGGDINICVHLIDGLPGENDEMMIETAQKVAQLQPEQIKIHLLHVLRETALEKMYINGEYTPLTQNEYVDIVCRQLEILPEDTVIGRLTGDGVKNELVAPLWSQKKVCVLNDIDKTLYERNTWQGKLYNNTTI